MDFPNSAKALLGFSKKPLAPSKKNVPDFPNTPASKTEAIPQEKDKMSKPSSYFSINPHTFTIKGRKGKEDKTVVDQALYYEKEILEIEYVPVSTVGTQKKYIKLANLKEIAKVLENGYSEDTTAVVLRERGYKELVAILKDNKILALDFCQWVKLELAKVPAKPRGRQVGSGKAKSSKTSEPVKILVAVLASYKPKMEVEEMASELKDLVNNNLAMEEAVSMLKKFENECSRDDKGYIKLRNRKKGKKEKQTK